jgi:hypothetical protein
MPGLNRVDSARLPRVDIAANFETVQEGAMGAVITFPEARRWLGAAPSHGPRASATVIILPVVRIEREEEAPSDAATETSKSPSGRKRRRRATRP